MKEIPLTQGKVALVDDADYEQLMAVSTNWRLLKKRSMFHGDCFYVRFRRQVEGKQVCFYMHRIIMNPPADFFVDHIDCDGLNNQRSNLRICSVAENTRNSRGRRRGFKGVERCDKKWRAAVSVMGRRIRTAVFATEEEAARAYDVLALRHFGEFARLNFQTK